MGRTIRIAVAGCAHGEMDKIYATMEELEKQSGNKFDMLICCGDYQAVRNYGDLHYMHVKERYRDIKTFYKYYSKEKTAPVLTLFVGGNHEASAYLAELPYGGWVAPNIFYMGLLGVVRFGGIRIAGLSGIYKQGDYDRGHYECPPFSDPGSTVSAYHVRSLEIFRAKQLESTPLDIFISHDWPGGIADYGNKEKLMRVKKFLKDDIESGRLGNPAARDLLFRLRPKYWLAAHMHVFFPALVRHDKGEGEEQPEPTRFLALDKPLPGRHFLQVLEIPSEEHDDPVLSYDEYWLAILRSTNSLVSLSKGHVNLPSSTSLDRFDFRPTREELESIRSLGSLIVPLDFEQTAPPMNEDNPQAKNASPVSYYRNPQSTRFCKWLGISDLNKMLCDQNPEHVGVPFYLFENTSDPNQIELEDFGDNDFIVDSTPKQDYLQDFQPPTISTSSTEDKPSTPDKVFKRRKVDFGGES